MMGNFRNKNVYQALGVQQSINAVGTGTTVGGAGPPEFVRSKMEESSLGFVDMKQLLEKSGEYLAKLFGTEAVYISSGGAAALTLSAAASMAGIDPIKITQLPDTNGIKSEILVPKKRMDEVKGYDRTITASGAKLVEFGSESAVTVEDLESAINSNTAAIYYSWPPYGALPLGMYNWPPPPGDPNILSPDEAKSIAKKYNIPVIVDGGAEIFPLDHIKKVAQSGDLVCFGGKYFGGPNATGIIAGTSDLIKAVSAQSFIPTAGALGVGRSMKLDRQQIVAIVVAVDEWFSMDHTKRISDYDEKISVIYESIKNLKGVDAKVQWEDNSFHGSYLIGKIDTEYFGKKATTIKDELFEGEPSILIQAPDAETIRLFVYTLYDGEEHTIAKRLCEILQK
tara:strand:+ start:2674 stop:3861 length:1188 start_codon:yes stop_codon:yes gene_type:complete